MVKEVSLFSFRANFTSYFVDWVLVYITYKCGKRATL